MRFWKSNAIIAAGTPLRDTAGASIDDIMEWFDGLDREQVKAVIEFAVRSLGKPPEYAPVP